jgi:DNA end-binding protein Ku
MLLLTMRFADEVVTVNQLGEVVPKAEVNERELRVAQQLIESLTADFEPERYRDDYRDRVLELINRKIKGEEVIAVPAAEAQPGRVIDLVSALEASLAEAKKKASRKKSA